MMSGVDAATMCQLVNVVRGDAMNENPYLRIETSREDDLDVVTVEGEIDIASAPTLQVVLMNVEAHRHVLLDLAGVYFMDSTALKVFVWAVMTRNEAGGSLHIRQCSPPVRRLLEMTALDDLLLQPNPV